MTSPYCGSNFSSGVLANGRLADRTNSEILAICQALHRSNTVSFGLFLESCFAQDVTGRRSSRHADRDFRPVCLRLQTEVDERRRRLCGPLFSRLPRRPRPTLSRSEEHTSELTDTLPFAV